MDIATLIALLCYLALMMAIGYYAYRTSTSDVSEYMLGGRRLHPAVGALSAGASDMSGWMLMGLPGAIYISGLSASWIAIGLCIGAYANYRLVAPRLRVYTEVANDALTIPDFFAKRFHDSSHLLRSISALVIVIFFTLYTSAGVVAGGKLFEAAFGQPYWLGVAITASVVVGYTLFGGFLAVSLTDFVQGIIMLMALLIVPAVAIYAVGGMEQAQTTMLANSADYLSLWSADTTWIGVISLAAWGLGYFGQPHIIVRFMAIRSLADMGTARRIGMSWMVLAIIGALATGALGLAYVQANGVTLNDPETIFIYLSQTLFHPFVFGFLLAAILAAIMSTISSQLLVSSSSLTEDFYRHFIARDASQQKLVLIGRLAVLAVAVVASLLALNPSSTILGLVANAWAGFGAAFGPIILLSLYWKRLTRQGALAGVVAGAVTVLVWIYAPLGEDGASLSGQMYELLPGFIVSMFAAWLTSLVTAEPCDDTHAHFHTMHSEIKEAKK